MLPSNRIAPFRSKTFGPITKNFDTMQRLDVFDTISKIWRRTMTCDENEQQIKVHYYKWSEKYDEWIDKDIIERIDSHGKHTRKETYWLFNNYKNV